MIGPIEGDRCSRPFQISQGGPGLSHSHVDLPPCWILLLLQLVHRWLADERYRLSRCGKFLGVAIESHSLSLPAMGQGVLASGMDGLDMTFGEGGRWPSYRDELLDAVAAGPSASLFTIGHGV
jgi:hypothetical protein